MLITHYPLNLLLRFPSDNVERELQRRSLTDIPGKKTNQGEQKIEGNSCTKSDSLFRTYFLLDLHLLQLPPWLLSFNYMLVFAYIR